MKSLEIKKIKLKSDFCLELEYSESITKLLGEEKQTVTSDITATYRYPVHEDLKKSLEALVPFVAHICEQIEHLTDEPSFLKSVTVTGISLGGSDEHSGVTIVAQRKLKNGKVLNLISPFTKFDPENSDYNHCVDLDNHCQIVVDEVNLYLGGKHAPDPQLELALEFESKMP